VTVLQSSKLQALAKTIADALQHEPVVASDVADGPSSLRRLSEKFRHDLMTRASTDLGVASSWIANMTSRQLISCFPDLHTALGAFKPRVEAAQKQAQVERANREAEAKKPVNVLGNSYVQYIYVKKCWEQRAGYASVYISDPEMELARNAVKRIEQKMKPEVTGNWTTESMWQEADRRAQAMPFFSRNFTDQSKNCKDVLGGLLKTYKEHFPEEFKTRKDF
jgi:hypothetical protein